MKKTKNKSIQTVTNAKFSVAAQINFSTLASQKRRSVVVVGCLPDTAVTHLLKRFDPLICQHLELDYFLQSVVDFVNILGSKG